jgi:hypothetical protein
VVVDPAAPVADLAAPAASVAAVSLEDFEQKYRVLQGKYNKEVPLLHRQLVDMQGQLTATQNILATMQAAPATPAAGSPADNGDDKMIETLRETYPEIHDAVERMTDKRVKTALNELKPQLESRVSRVEHDSAERGKQDFYERLDADYPEWEKVNTHPTFVAWLQRVDELSGRTRQALILEAFNAKDVRRCSLFFRNFVKDNPTLFKPSVPAGQAAAASARSGGNVDVHPVTSGSPAPLPTPRGNVTIIKRADVAKFYSDVVAGKYNGKEPDKIKREKEIERAVAEGRVR